MVCSRASSRLGGVAGGICPQRVGRVGRDVVRVGRVGAARCSSHGRTTRHRATVLEMFSPPSCPACLFSLSGVFGGQGRFFVGRAFFRRANRVSSSWPRTLSRRNAWRSASSVDERASASRSCCS
mgnify:CR=1 FL=1